MVYPGKDLIFYQADVSGGDLVRERMRVLRALLEKRPVTIVTTMSALMMPQTPLSGIVSRILHFDKKVNGRREEAFRSAGGNGL